MEKLPIFHFVLYEIGIKLPLPSLHISAQFHKHPPVCWAQSGDNSVLLKHIS
jgi:hypothetical protein